MPSQMAGHDEAWAALPCRRWDVLSAVLAESQPELSMHVRRILRLQTANRISDLELFSLICMRSSPQLSPVLCSAISHAMLKETFMEWFKETYKRIKQHKSVASASAGDLSTEASTSSTNIPPPPSRQETRYPSATASGNALDQHRELVLEADWEWDGTLDMFRDGKTLCALVEECLRLKSGDAPEAPTAQRSGDRSSKDRGSKGRRGRWRTLDSNTVRSPLGPNSPTRAQASSVPTSYDIVFPSLADLDRLQERSPTTILERSRHRRGHHNASAVLEERCIGLLEANLALLTLNKLCERYLGFTPTDEHDMFMEPASAAAGGANVLNSADAVLVRRLHWLALALHRFVDDDTKVPCPQRVSYLLFNEFEGGRCWAEEDNEIAVAVATQCSCLPFNHHLQISVPAQNSLCIAHRLLPQPRYFFSFSVGGKVFVQYESRSCFIPFWALLRSYLMRFDQLYWEITLSAAEERHLQLLFGDDMPPSPGTSVTSPPAVVAPSTSRKRASHNPLHRHFSPGRAAESGGRDSGATQRSSPSSAVYDLCVSSAATSLAGRVGATAPAVASASASAAPTAPNSQKGLLALSEDTSAASFVCPPATVKRTRDTAVARVRMAPEEAAGSDQDDDAGRRHPSIASVTKPSHADPSAADGAPGEATGHGEGAGEAAPEPMTPLPVCVLSPMPTGQSGQWDAPSVGNGSIAVVSETLSDEPETSAEVTSGPRSSFSQGGGQRCRNFQATVMSESGTLINISDHHFRISGRPIGRGAFGAVYRALNLDTGVLVAVKQSRYSLRDNGERLAGLRELETWSMLPSHPNVISFYAATKERNSGELFIVLEYASGGSILSLYQAFNPVPTSLLYQHARGMAMGLKHLHDHAVIHGDVKPENVLFRSDGRVALSDFGCSRLIRSVVGDGEEEGALAPAGTVAYMAPEVIAGEPHFKSDVWALACTLVQLCIDQLPWSGPDCPISLHEPIPLMFYISENDVIPYDAAQIRATPPWLQRIAHRAFERDVAARCNMSEILAILLEYE